TYGRVSRYGLVAFGSSLDQIGVLGRSVHDAARVLSVISGRDPRDSTCEDRDPLRLPTVPESLQGFVIGIPKEYFPADLDPVARASVARCGGASWSGRTCCRPAITTRTTARPSRCAR